MPLLNKLVGAVAIATTPAAGWAFYTRSSHFVPFDTSSPDFSSPIALKLNPHRSKPKCIDECVRKVPLSRLQTTDQAELTKRFCQGVWSGLGFAYQRRFLEKKYRALEGREKDLWDTKDLRESDYPVGERITDHFEVVERTDERVTVRCGDSPLKQDRRPSDGLFTIEVTKDEVEATFHLKSTFYNSTPEGIEGGPLPWWFEFAHREYTKLWMETSVRKILK